jgi:Zn-dependent metalloprotease
MKQILFSRRNTLFSLLLILSLSTIAQKTTQQLEESQRKISSDPFVQSVQFSEDLKTPSFISFRSGSQMRTTAVQSLKKYFELSASNELRLVSSTQDKYNVTVDLYKQFYKGVIVEHSAYNVISKNGQILSISAESYPLDESFSVTPLNTPDAFRSNALNFVNAKKYAWEALEEDKKRFPGKFIAQQKLEELKNSYLPKGELVIAKDVFGDKQAHLAYKYDVYAVEPLLRYYIYVDAKNGNILLSDAIIKHTDNTKAKQEVDKDNKLSNYQFYALFGSENYEDKGLNFTDPSRVTAGSELGTALSRYSGIQKIYTTKVSVPITGKPDPNNPSVNLTWSGVDPRQPIVGPIDVYILKDQTRGQGVETYDLNNVGGLPLSIPALQGQALAFVDRDNNWKDEADNGAVTKDDLIRGATRDGSNGGNEAVNDDIAIDAHWGAEMVYDYWQKRHNRASFDNKNSAIKSYIHYGPAYDNAFWNGTTMTYGDGSGTANPRGGFRPLVSLDICGHEIGHGVCSHTSDLVYRGESGAMNEGLSDIWAAAVEHFVDDSVKMSPTPTYQYFQVGENIAANNEGLRRMDNTKRFSNPDTYGGRYWSNPECGTPTLVNDQCGVHNNSGVLNKWFYLMVMGPKKITGSPSYTDDGVADKPRSVPKGSGFSTDFVENTGNNYGALSNFTGIGFEAAEDITYLMEQILTPNATYADARAASITAAQALYGVCSLQERTVTNAWFGVGVGSAFGGCTAPLMTVLPATSTIGEGAPGDCPRYNDVKINANLTVAQTASTPITITVTGGTLGSHEYQLLTNTLTFAAGETGLKSIPFLRIFDDAVFEPNETLTISATAPSIGYSNSFTITVRDNDSLPFIGGIKTLLKEDFEGTALSAIPGGWDTIPKIAPSAVRWAVEIDNASPVLHWAGKRAIIELNPPSALTNGKAVYDQLTSAQTILRTPLINGMGLDSLKLEFTYSAGGEPACSPACDYGQVVYSYDGVSFSKMFPEDSVLYAQVSDRRAVYALPSQLNNRQFYIGFLWNNDSNGGTSASITIDDVLITGKGKRIARDSASSVSEPIPSITQEGNAPSFLYSRYDGSLMSKIVNSTANLGCVKDTLTQSGTGYVAYSTGFRTKKVHQITPSQNSNSKYTLTLYYANEELVGQDPRSLLLLKSNAANIDASTTANSIVVVPIVEDHSADGYWSYTATFNGFSYFALVTAGNNAPAVYYPRTNATDLSQPSNWTTDPNGGAGTSPTNFTTPNQLFNINNNVTIPLVNAPWTIANGSNVILLNNNGATFNPTARLTVGTGSNFNFNGLKGILKSDATGTASIGITTGSISNADSINAERYMQNKRAWRLLGIPFSASGQTIKQAWQEGATLLSQNPNPPYGTQITTFIGDARAAAFDAIRPSSSIRIYAADNFNSDLVHTPNTLDNITQYQGYFLFVRGDRSTDRTSTGSPSSSANLRITGVPNMGAVTKGVLGTSFSLIPNPYLSPLDFDSIKAIASNSSINKFYVWDPALGGGVGQYRTIDITGSAPTYTYTATPGGSNNNWRFIEQGVAFMISGSKTVDFTENTKSTGTPPASMLRTLTNKQAELVINFNDLNTSPASLSDGVRLVFDNTYSLAIDRDDAKKVEGFNVNFGINKNNEILSVEKRPLPTSDEVIALKLWNSIPGNYQFEVQPSNIPANIFFAYLKDNFLNTFTPIDLQAGTRINFSITADAASAATDRFSIVFTKSAVSPAAPTIVIYPNPVQTGNVKVLLNNMPRGTYFVRMINSLGQTVLSKQINHTGGTVTETLSVNKVKGVYTLEVQKPDNTKQIKKLIVN